MRISTNELIEYISLIEMIENSSSPFWELGVNKVGIPHWKENQAGKP
jgi:hypothetical protein